MLDRRRFRFLLFFVLLFLFPAPVRSQIVDRAKNGSLNVAWNGVGVEPAGSTVRISLAGQGAAAAQVTGTFVATLSFEALIDEKAATWLAIKGTPFTGGTNVSSTTGAGAWVFPLSGVRTLRIRCSAYTSGTANIGMISTPAVSTVTIAGGTGGSATSVSDADSSPFAIGTDPFNPIGGTFNDAAAALTAGQQGIQRLTPNRAGHVNLRNNAGTEIGTAAAPVRTDPTGTTPQPVSGTVTANVGTTNGLALDATLSTASAKLPAALVGGRLDVNIGATAVTQPVSGTVTANAGTGNFSVAGTKTNNNAAPGATNVGTLSAVANAAAQSWTEGNQVALSTDLAGSLRALIASPLPTGTNSIGAVTQGAAPWNIQGQQANGAAVTEQPVLIAGQNAGSVKLFALDAAGQATVNQGGTGSGGAAAWFAQGPDAAGTAVAGRPFGEGISDGTNVQIAKQITSATGTTGVGLPGVGPALWDLVGTTNYIKQAGDGSGRAMVVGAAASGAAAAGNPVLIGGNDGTNAVSVKIGTGTAAGLIGAYTGSGVTLADGMSNTTIVGPFIAAGQANGMGSGQLVLNGSTWDRQRSNVDVTLLASAARTTTQTSADIVTYNAHSIMVTLDMTVVGTGSVTLTINYKDPASGKYILLLSGVAVVTNITSLYRINPNIPAVANVTAQSDLGRVIQIVVTANNANTATYSVGYTLIN